MPCICQFSKWVRRSKTGKVTTGVSLTVARLEAARFEVMIDGLLARARRGNARTRVYGETVALLWARGEHEATVALERSWNDT